MKHVRLLVLIVLGGFLLRIYPYFHYPYLITNDAMRDFQQVQFLLENEQINWAHAYGRNPTLHLVVYMVSLFGGVEARYIDLFVPQLISSLGILFFYLFLKSYVGERYALFSSFFLATFGPNIWWGSQAVRETVGLFFFPFVLYAFDRFATGSIKRLFVLAISFLTMLITHNLTTFVAVGMITVLALTRYQNGGAMIVAGMSALIMTLYWKFKFTWYYDWVVGDSFSILKLFPLLIFGILFLYFVGKWCQRKEFGETEPVVRKLDIVLVVIYGVIFFVLMSYFSRLLVFDYPPQEYLSIFLLGLFFAIGIRKIKLNYGFYIPMVMMNMPLLVLLVIGLVFGTEPNFDAARIVEYLVYPNALFAAIGLDLIIGALNNRQTKYLLIFVITLSGLMIYPPVFILGRQISQDSVFYDIRSHIRYIPDEGIDIMKWGKQNSYTILSVNPNLNSLRDTLYFVEEKKAFLVSEYDYMVLESIDKVQIRPLGIGSPEGAIEASKNAEEIYRNEWGVVYEWNENMTNETVIGEYVQLLRVR